MTHTLDRLQCGCRIGPGCFLACSAADDMMLTGGNAPPVPIRDPMRMPGGKLRAGLMLVNALWLTFGVRPRLMAILATVLFSGMALVVPGWNG